MKHAIAVFWLSAVSALRLTAQTESGAVHLTIQDASGAAMRAHGRLQNSASGITRAFTTGDTGEYDFKALPLGRYRLEVSHEGFATKAIAVLVDSSAVVSQIVKLAIGTAGFTVDVVGLTPLAGAESPVEAIPAPVQVLSATDVKNSSALNVSELMNRRLANVFINENQGNPFQPDLNYRGYTASPLLGTPEGISVYQDGVRLNQPFGDVVSWDLIPKIAIQDMTLIPGSNPLFGLNTLGGALSMQTKDGASHPGTTIQASGGSFGQRAVEFDHGWSNLKGVSWYVAGNLYHEDGWRKASPSDVRQAFSKIGWQSDKTSVHLSGSYADNSLTGNGVQDQRLLAQDYSSVYTIPDVTTNRAPYLNLTVRHMAARELSVTGNVYFRYIRADTLNGDINEDSLDQSVYQPSAAEIRVLSAAGYTGIPTAGANASNTPFPYFRCIGQVLLNDEPGEKCNGQLNRTYLKQHNYGFSAQATWLTSPGATRNQFTLGTAYDRSSAGFQQTAQLGYLNPDRSITPLNAIEDGVHAGNVDGVPRDARVFLRGLIHTTSVYATDTISAGKQWTFTISGRYNRNVVDNHDRIQPGGGPGSLNGHYLFGRLNPSAGFTYRPLAWLSVYGSYSEGSRAPTSIELGCADPNEPCRLPNALAGDPALKKVVTRTVDAGLRGDVEGRLSWNAGFFHAQNYNDLLFVSSTATGFGYFKNFGRTQRQGVEIGIRDRIRRFMLGGNYTYLDATYQTAETVDGSSNSASSAPGFEGVIHIVPGNRIPQIPHHIVKAFASYKATSRLDLDLDFRAISTTYARGNENNLSVPDGRYYLGPGTSPGYGVLDLGARFRVGKHFQLFTQINNLLNHRYYSAAVLSPTGFTAAGTFLARPFPAIAGEYPLQHATFYAPGAPIAVRGGVRLAF